jgi:uncharacterized protein YgiM (DUF1202 family)
MKLGSILLLIMCGSVCGALMAENGYIYEKNKGIWSLKGSSKDFGVHTKYPAGTLLEIIKNEEQNGYSHVSDENGNQSWILSSYLLPAKSVLLDKALLDMEQLKISHELGLKKLQSALSARAPLEEVNQKLQSKIATMQMELEELRHAKSLFTDRFNREVYFAGGVTIIVGIFLGWLFFSGRRKRNDAWG